jgi:hypothetical protein
MALLSASEDFSSRTLAAIPHAIGKLQYVAQLQQQSGVYAHWGLCRTFGDAAANEAIAGAHSRIFIEILRMPLSDLWNEIRSLASQTGTEASQFVNTLASKGDLLIPQSLKGGSIRHFNSVLKSLSALANDLGLGSGRGA